MKAEVGMRKAEFPTAVLANGSVGTVHYSGVGGSAMPKERIEVLRGGNSWVLDDFRELIAYAGEGEKRTTARRVDKGHAELLARAFEACRGQAPFSPGLREGYAAQAVGLAALESIRSGEAVDVRLPG